MHILTKQVINCLKLSTVLLLDSCASDVMPSVFDMAYGTSYDSVITLNPACTTFPMQVLVLNAFTISILIEAAERHQVGMGS